MKSIAELHWDYFLFLEADLVGLFRYVEPSEQNAGSYGPEILKLFLSACTEIEAVFKDLARNVATDSPAAKKKQPSMRDYSQLVQGNFQQEFDRVGAKFLGSDIVVEPWNARWDDDADGERIASDNAIPWWRAYTDVKHDRAKDYPEANLGNLLNAMGGLMIAASCLFRHMRPHALPRCTQVADYADGRYGANNTTAKVEGHALVIGSSHFDIKQVE